MKVLLSEARSLHSQGYAISYCTVDTMSNPSLSAGTGYLENTKSQKTARLTAHRKTISHSVSNFETKFKILSPHCSSPQLEIGRLVPEKRAIASDRNFAVSHSLQGFKQYWKLVCDLAEFCVHYRRKYGTELTSSSA